MLPTNNGGAMLQYEYVRINLRTALANFNLKQNGQLESLNMGSGAGNRFREKPRRKIEINGKFILVDAEPFHYTETGKFQRSTVLIDDITYDCCDWRRAVHLIPEDSLAWVKYCYAHDLNFDHQISICKNVYQRFISLCETRKMNKMSAKTAERMKQLIWLAVQFTVSELRDEPARCRNNYSDLSREIGISRYNWKKNYQPRWELMIEACQNVDQEALAYVDRRHRN
ncbi:putative Antitermination protein Q [Xenorhabdus bovienii str. feltiae Florida]|nr:putative Antitermination protein Q [Xenorhabdus bovienii str. feltiae Florida]